MANRDIHRQIMEERGVDIRLPSTALLGISSADRYKSNSQRQNLPTTPYDFTLQSPQNFLTGFFTRIALTEIKFNWTIPTITARNDSIYIYYQPNNAGPVARYLVQLTADDGWHTPTTLAGVLQTRVRVATGNAGFTLTADVNTGVFTGATNNTDVFAFGTVTTVNAVGNNTTGLYEMMNWGFRPTQTVGVPNPIVITDTDTGSTFNGFLQNGFLNITSTPTGAVNGGDTITGAGILAGTEIGSLVKSSGTPSLATPRIYTIADDLGLAVSQQSGIPTMLSTEYVDIVCSQLTYNQDVKDADSGVVSRDVLARVYLAQEGVDQNPELLGSQPFSLYRKFDFPKQIKWNRGQNIGGFLKFEVYDDAGFILTTGVVAGDPPQFLDYTQGDWNMTLLVSEV